jgi:hypothetical protein
MNLSINIDTSEVDRHFARLGRQFSKDIAKGLSATAQRGTNIILDRTEKGRGYLAPFPAYTQEYAAFRSKKGRSTTPDLNFSGKMLGSMRSKVNKPEMTADIYFSRVAEAKKAAANNKKRPFFGFNDKEKNYLRKWFYKYLSL